MMAGLLRELCVSHAHIESSIFDSSCLSRCIQTHRSFCMVDSTSACQIACRFFVVLRKWLRKWLQRIEGGLQTVNNCARKVAAKN